MKGSLRREILFHFFTGFIFFSGPIFSTLGIVSGEVERDLGDDTYLPDSSLSTGKKLRPRGSPSTLGQS